MTKAKVPQMSLPFMTEGLSGRISGTVHPRVVEILTQMLIGAVLNNRSPQEKDHEREDSTDPS